MDPPFPLDTSGVRRGRRHHAVTVVFVPLQKLLPLHLRREREAAAVAPPTFQPAAAARELPRSRTHLLDVLQLQRPLVDAGVRDVVALGVLQHQRQVRVDLLHRLVLVVPHPVPVGNYGHSHLERRAQKYQTVHSECV